MDCPQEESQSGFKVTWPSSSLAENATSQPLCFRNERLITRNCNGTHWEPSYEQLQACQQIVNYFGYSKCPPGHHQISENSGHCYQINKRSAWNHPCYKSGKTTVITDLEESEIFSLLTSLNATKHKYFWLPAQRSKVFNPVVWHVPGPNWGRTVETNTKHSFLQMRAPMMKNCLLLNVEQRTVITETCSLEYPSLCFSVNEFRYPLGCPDRYYGFRFMSDDNICYGIEESDNETGLTYDEFVNTKCSRPSPRTYQGLHGELTRYVFTKLAAMNSFNSSKWCWYQIFSPASITMLPVESDDVIEKPQSTTLSAQGVINGDGVLSLRNKTSKFTCMACEVEMNFSETEFMFEYNDKENKMYLTVYYPSGLWKSDDNDKGVQCFSNAKGFVKIVDFNDKPFFEVKQLREVNDFGNLDKVVYEIDPITYRAAQYWCEGHTKNFTLVATDKLIVNPNCNEEHVFAIVLEKYNIAYDTDEPDMSSLTSRITEIFNANKVLLMDILDFSIERMILLMHLHVAIIDIYDDTASNIKHTLLTLKETAEIELPKYNYTFVNISSSIYCLPTTSDDISGLKWDLTRIGQIAAPQQFCLQANGLPVKRHCLGSYLFGGIWGDVEGLCDSTYEPSWTTKFLFDFMTGNIPSNVTTSFLTNGLGVVLGNVNNLIPADLYYLSMSLQHVLYLAENNTSVDLGDIDNAAWVMDRVMSVDHSYLLLSQTLNSTNVILDSVNEIIEHLVEEEKSKESNYFLAVKPHFVVQTSYPIQNNITGIAIINNSSTDDFTEMAIIPLFKNTTLSDVLAIKNLEVATWLSDQILESVQSISDNTTSSNVSNTNNELYVVITVFYNDAMFPEIGLKRFQMNSRVIGISIPGYSTNLEHAVPLVFKEVHTSSYDDDKICGYWNFESNSFRDLPGFWGKKGCLPYKSTNSITVCECYHLTHFGQLINAGSSSNNKEVQSHHKKVLNIITLVGSFISLLGIVGIWITACVFSSWRQKAGTKVLLHLSSSIALPLIFMVVFNLDTTIIVNEQGIYKVAEHMEVLCIILGALLHYSILSSFVWMFITAALQFVRYVRVLGVCRPSRFMMKCTVLGWGLPLIPITVILLIDTDNYIPEPTKSDMGRYLICYPTGFILTMSVIVPICVILATNIALFAIILYSIYRGPDGKMRTTDIDLIGAQFRLSIILFFLLGLTWIFGILSFTNNYLWSYLFCLTSTLQGFVLFVYFVVCDPNTRNMWISLMTPNRMSTYRPRESITSISSG
ncbi:uncharacterized protein LOC125225877 isoform X2 [Leguminivora glycinivorella]|uniref:uncharacterized protein LOC125225877 isoform X2 n=1 Tax=Leguminivora glycinivorella TaxID=1035111 RepID=UPI00200F75D1|nr:uncharacterized protein LOC125225877 isoform X2 [Leguminivora glycinivorella]